MADTGNIQAIAAGSHQALARFGFVRLESQQAGRGLLRGLHDWITTPGGRQSGPNVRFGVALSAAGLAMLGVPVEDLAPCPALFRDGPAAFAGAGPDSGSGDVGRWDRAWRNHPADLLCVMYAAQADELDTHWDWLGELVENSANRMLDRQDALCPASGRDHFGLSLPQPATDAPFPDAREAPAGLAGDGTWWVLHKMAENVPLFRRIAEAVETTADCRVDAPDTLQVRGLVYGTPLPGRLDDDRRDRGLLLAATASDPGAYLRWLADWRLQLEAGIRLAGEAPPAHVVGIHDRLPELLTTRGLRTFFMPGMRALRLLM